MIGCFVVMPPNVSEEDDVAYNLAKRTWIRLGLTSNHDLLGPIQIW
jgi:hypothetical protein